MSERDDRLAAEVIAARLISRRNAAWDGYVEVIADALAAAYRAGELAMRGRAAGLVEHWPSGHSGDPMIPSSIRALPVTPEPGAREGA